MPRARATARPIPIHRRCPIIDHEQALAGKLREDYFEPGLPVVVRGGMADWEAMRKWQNTEYLSSVFGDASSEGRVAVNAGRTARPRRA